MIGLMLQPPANTPDDARALARSGLLDLREKIKNALPQKDRLTSAHLEESHALIHAALEARSTNFLK